MAVHAGAKKPIGNVEAAFEALGPRGLYNMTQFFLQSLMLWLIPFQMYNIVFSGIHNPHRCPDIDPRANSTELHLSSNSSLTSTLSYPYNFSLTYASSSLKVYHDTCSRPRNLSTTSTLRQDERSTSSSWGDASTCSAHELEYENPRDRSFVSEFHLNCDREYMKGLTQTFLSGGIIAGTFIFPRITDKFGRKPILVVATFLAAGSSLCLAFSTSYTMFIVAKFFTGFFTWGIEGAVTIIFMESLATQDRSRFFAGFVSLTWTSGVIIMSPIAYALRNYSWRVFQLACTALYIHIFLNIIFSDETLRWLAANGYKKRAEAVLRRASRWNGKDPEKVLQAFYSDDLSGAISHSTPIYKGGLSKNHATHTENEHELELITHTMDVEEKALTNESFPDLDTKSKLLTKESSVDKDVEIEILTNDSPSEQDAEVLRIWHLFTEPILLKHTLYVFISWFFNNVTYLGLILMSSTLAGGVYLNYALNALAELPQAIFCYFFLGRVGRRLAISVFCVISGLSLIAMAVLRAWAPNQHVLIVVLSLMGKVGVTGSFNVIYTYTPELFPTNLRNTGLGFAALGSGSGGMLAPYAEMLFKVAVYAPGLVFGTSILGLSLLTRFLPETTHHPLPQTLGEMKRWKVTPLWGKATTRSDTGHDDES